MHLVCNAKYEERKSEGENKSQHDVVGCLRGEGGWSSSAFCVELSIKTFLHFTVS